MGTFGVFLFVVPFNSVTQLNQTTRVDTISDATVRI